MKASSDNSTFVIGNGDLVLASSALVNGRYIQNAIGVQVKSHLNLRNAAWSWRDTSQLKLAKKIIVLRHCTLTFVHLPASTNMHR